MNKMILSTIVVLATAQISFAQSCVEEVDCQNSKLDAMSQVETVNAQVSIAQVRAELSTLEKLATKLANAETEESGYQGYAKALLRVDAIHGELLSMRQSHYNGLSTEGRSLFQIHQEILEITTALKSN